MGLKERMEQSNEQVSGYQVLVDAGALTTASDMIKAIAPEKLHSFQRHTFQVNREQPDYLSLREAIKDHGIQNPLLVRPHAKVIGEHEVIAGHRRLSIALELGLESVPCMIKSMDDDTAIQLMGISNIQRPDWLPSEKAKTYKEHMEATQRKTGIKERQRTDLTAGTGFPQFRNREEAAKIWGITGRTLEMYIKLNDLLPKLLDMVDSGRIVIKAGYQLAFLSLENQAILEGVLQQHPKKKVSKAIARDLRTSVEMKTFTEEKILQILGLAPNVNDGKGHSEINVRFSPSSPLKNSTVKQALEDPHVLARIEEVIRAYAEDNDLPIE